MKILYGTTNKAKLQTMRNALVNLDIEIIGLNPNDKNLPVIVECGKTPLENAEIKAKAYYAHFHMPVISCDSGLYFQEVKPEEQPGIFVRRVNGKELTDEEMIDHYATLAQRYGGTLTAQYLNAMYFIWDAQHCYSCMDASIASEPFLLSAIPHKKRVEGFPLDSLSIDRESGQYFYDLFDGNVSFSVERGIEAFFQDILKQITLTD